MRMTVVLAFLSSASAFAATNSFKRLPFTTRVTTTEAELRWSQASGGATISYGPKGGAMMTKTEAATSGAHDVTLTGLAHSTRYAYSIDAGSGVVTSGEFVTAVMPTEPFTFIAYG